MLPAWEGVGGDLASSGGAISTDLVFEPSSVPLSTAFAMASPEVLEWGIQERLQE